MLRKFNSFLVWQSIECLPKQIQGMDVIFSIFLESEIQFKVIGIIC